LKIKIPPHFKEPAIDCPRCGNHLEVPLAEMSAMIIAAGEVEKIKGEKSIRKNAQEKPKIYHRRGMGWESFYCSCGKLLQISPQFEGKYVTCNKCGRKTEIS
jgi:DNA-directed RNA polymerase subunit M/transcription elongation factor TFIIS